MARYGCVANFNHLSFVGTFHRAGSIHCIEEYFAWASRSANKHELLFNQHHWLVPCYRHSICKNPEIFNVYISQWKSTHQVSEIKRKAFVLGLTASTAIHTSFSGAEILYNNSQCQQQDAKVYRHVTTVYQYEIILAPLITSTTPWPYHTVK